MPRQARLVARWSRLRLTMAETFMMINEIASPDFEFPLILVGGIRSYDWAMRILSEGYADYISLSQPLICESGLINRWKSGDTASVVSQKFLA